jgi:hypothetical protein
MGEVSPGGVFLGVFSRRHKADHERASPRYYISVDAASAKDVPLRSHRYFSSHGRVIPKNNYFRDVNVDSNLNIYARISAQKKRIITIHGSKYAFRQDTQMQSRKNTDGSSQGQISTFLQKLIQLRFSAKTPC